MIVTKAFERTNEYLKRLIAACLVFFMAIGMVTVSASPAGSMGNPLISRGYLEGVFADSLRADIYEQLDGAIGLSLSRLNDMYLEAAGYSFAGRFTPIAISAGEAISLGPGASFILHSGSAVLNIGRGVVINISSGTEVTSGTALAFNQRFFCTENTTAIVAASTAVTGLVDGFHHVGDAPATPPQQPLPPPPPPPIPPETPPLPTGPLPFADVHTTAWFYDAVDFVFRNGLFSGTTQTTFSPNAPMTRGMFVTVLHRLEGLPDVGMSRTFTDVRDPQAFFYDAVAWASTHEIVTGFADGSFRPNDSITREQMAAIMHRYATHRERSMVIFDTALDVFPDNRNVSSFALEPMKWAVTWQILRGSTGGRLLPRNTASRAEVAQIILNYTQNVGI